MRIQGFGLMAELVRDIVYQNYKCAGEKNRVEKSSKIIEAVSNRFGKPLRQLFSRNGKKRFNPRGISFDSFMRWLRVLRSLQNCFGFWSTVIGEFI
jgi:hypothetical protein